MSLQPDADGGPVRNRHLVTLIKLLVGGAILWVIASKLSIDDRVVMKDGGERTGRGLQFDGALLLSIDGEAEPRRFSLRDGITPFFRRGEEWRVEGQVGQQLTLEGALSLRSDDGVVEVPLDDVRVEDIGEQDGWTEQSLEIREGLATIYGRIKAINYVLAMACILGMYLCGIKRWQILLRAQSIQVGFFEAMRLTFIGFFFNNVVPGMTGGDVVKAVMIARAHKGRGPDAVSTVIVDRVIGLLVLAAIAAVVLLFALDTYGTIAQWVFLMLAFAGAMICLFLSRRVRRALRIDRLLKRLPAADALQRLDDAFMLYRSKHKKMAACVGLSVIAHIFNIASVYCLGVGLGVDEAGGLQAPEILTYMVVVPIIMIVAAVPLLPGGWGVGEFAFGYFFRSVGIQNLSLSVGLSVLHRLSMLLWSLLGGIFLVLGRQDAREAVKQARTLEPDRP